MATAAKTVSELHAKEFGKEPDIMVSTPGRFHLLGDHSWFFKDKTVSMAVNLPVYIAVSLRDDQQFHFYYVQADERKKSSVTALKFKKEDRWANVLKAMLYGFSSGGFDLKGLDITVYTEIQPSAGFGITTAMKVGTAYAVRQLLKFQCSEVQLLQVIERGNRLFLHVENYLADNFSALYSKPGTVMLTDHARQTWENVAFDFPGRHIMLTDARVPRISIWNEESIREPEYALLLGDLRVRKANVYGGWLYESDKTEINETLSTVSEDVRRKLLYVIGEHQHVLEAYEGLATGNFELFARAVNQSHEILGELYNISCPEIDWILKRVGEFEPRPQNIWQPLNCGRLTGKGFGRCLYAFLRDSDLEPYNEKLYEYSRIFGFEPIMYEVKAARGAHVVRP